MNKLTLIFLTSIPSLIAAESPTLGTGLVISTKAASFAETIRYLALDDSVTAYDIPSLRTNAEYGARASTNELGIDFLGNWELGGTRLTIGATTSTLKTNVVNGDNTKWEIDPTRILTSYPPQPAYRISHQPTERWAITNVVETHTLVFNWRGKSRTISEDVLIHSTTNRQVLKQEWFDSPGIPEALQGSISTPSIWTTTSAVFSEK